MSSKTSFKDMSNLGVGDERFLALKPDESYRIFLLEEPTFAVAQFLSGVGFIRTLSKYEWKNGKYVMIEVGADVELFGKDPQFIFCVPVVEYAKEFKSKKPEYKLKLWTFYERDARRLRELAVEWDELTNNDVIITTRKQGKYTAADFGVAKEAFIKTVSGLEERIREEFAVWRYRDVDKQIAATVTEDQLREQFAATEASQSGSVKSHKR